MVGLELKGRLLPVELPDGTPGKAVAPGLLRPVNRNESLFLFSRTATPWEVIQLDRRGNVFKLTINPKRWRKELLLLTDKTALQQ